jgi:hypothetical protein
VVDRKIPATAKNHTLVVHPVATMTDLSLLSLLRCIILFFIFETYFKKLLHRLADTTVFMVDTIYISVYSDPKFVTYKKRSSDLGWGFREKWDQWIVDGK